jgi:four helix bundle protein
MFSHQKLRVYQKALNCVAALARDSRTWPKRHAFVDHLLRASESVLMNLVEATRLRRSDQRQHVVDYAVGSALECAACLDVAVKKELLMPSIANNRKESLCEVVRILVGLRKSWANDQLQEEEGEYRITQKIFAYERLEVYQIGVQFIGWFQAQPAGAALSSRLFLQLDKLGTSVVLNIAEGNGRYEVGDRRTFLATAEASAAKSAAYLDLICESGDLDPQERDVGLELLRRVAQMLHAMTCG